MSVVKPKASFFIVLLLVVAALVVYALRGVIFPEAGDAQRGGGDASTITTEDLAPVPSGGEAVPAGVTEGGDAVEGPDEMAPTTVKEYSYVASEKLPPVKA
jgi:hypothetical protein